MFIAQLLPYTPTPRKPHIARRVQFCVPYDSHKKKTTITLKRINRFVFVIQAQCAYCEETRWFVRVSCIKFRISKRCNLQNLIPKQSSGFNRPTGHKSHKPLVKKTSTDSQRLNFLDKLTAEDKK